MVGAVGGTSNLYVKIDEVGYPLSFVWEASYLQQNTLFTIIYRHTAGSPRVTAPYRPYELCRKALETKLFDM